MATWIRTPEGVRDLARSLEGCRAVAIDTESDSLYHYYEKVCLLQIATERDGCRLVDTLAVRDLSPLAAAMAQPGLVKVLHGADYDVCSLKRDFGLGFVSIFDTMIAARLLGRLELGLAALARDELGVTLSKQCQKDDWSRRPLSPQQETYAANDVAHLVALHDRLTAQLRAAGRLAWLEEECAAIAAIEPAQRRQAADAYLAIKGARRLAPRALAALRELHAWRERRAEKIDVPPFKVLGNDALLRLAAMAPETADFSSGLPGAVQRHARELRAALERAHALPDSELPVLPRSPRPIVPDAVLRRIERLKEFRVRKAAELKLDVSVVLPQRLIDRLAEAAPADREGLAAIDGLRRWRIEAFGPELLARL